MLSNKDVLLSKGVLLNSVKNALTSRGSSVQILFLNNDEILYLIADKFQEDLKNEKDRKQEKYTKFEFKFSLTERLKLLETQEINKMFKNYYTQIIIDFLKKIFKAMLDQNTNDKQYSKALNSYLPDILNQEKSRFEHIDFINTQLEVLNNYLQNKEAFITEIDAKIVKQQQKQQQQLLQLQEKQQQQFQNQQPVRSGTTHQHQTQRQSNDLNKPQIINPTNNPQHIAQLNGQQMNRQMNQNNMYSQPQYPHNQQQQSGFQSQAQSHNIPLNQNYAQNQRREQFEERKQVQQTSRLYIYADSLQVFFRQLELKDVCFFVQNKYNTQSRSQVSAILNAVRDGRVIEKLPESNRQLQNQQQSQPHTITPQMRQEVEEQLKKAIKYANEKNFSLNMWNLLNYFIYQNMQFQYIHLIFHNVKELFQTIQVIYLKDFQEQYKYR